MHILSCVYIIKNMFFLNNFGKFTQGNSTQLFIHTHNPLYIYKHFNREVRAHSRLRCSVPAAVWGLCALLKVSSAVILDTIHNHLSYPPVTSFFVWYCSYEPATFGLLVSLSVSVSKYRSFYYYFLLDYTIQDSRSVLFEKRQSVLVKRLMPNSKQRVCAVTGLKLPEASLENNIRTRKTSETNEKQTPHLRSSLPLQPCPPIRLMKQYTGLTDREGWHPPPPPLIGWMSDIS